jgi:hypothetical protein
MRTNLGTAVSIAASAMLFGCATVTSIPDDAVPLVTDAARAAAFEQATSPYRHNSGFLQRERRVIRTGTDWQAAWQTLVKNSEPKPAAPAVDFTRDMVVLAAMGTRSSGGYSIQLRAFESSLAVFAEVVETSPGPTCMVTAALTQPVTLLLVPARAGDVKFIERSETRSCG